MNEHQYPFIIVVEGATDKALISSFMDVEIVITNGSAVSRGTINYLKEASKTKDIIVLTDPDSPGKKIRDLLDQEIPNLKHAFVLKEKSIKHGKVGVAESDKEHILDAISHLIPSCSKATKCSNIEASDLYELGLLGQPDSARKREKLEINLHLGHCNGKTLLKRARALGLKKDDLRKALDE